MLTFSGLKGSRLVNELWLLKYSIQNVYVNCLIRFVVDMRRNTVTED